MFATKRSDPLLSTSKKSVEVAEVSSSAEFGVCFVSIIGVCFVSIIGENEGQWGMTIVDSSRLQRSKPKNLFV